MALEEIVGCYRWDTGMPVLEIREQSTVAASDALVAAMPSDAWENLGLTISRVPLQVGWTVRSSDKAGVARIRVQGTVVHVRVMPKISGLDMFFLADWAYGSPGAANLLRNGRADLDAVRDDPAACLLGWYLAEVVAFAMRWVRRGYVVRDAELVGRIRGRIDFPRYAAKSVARARPHVVPVRFAEASHDTVPNQYLKAGLRRASALVRALPNPRARRYLLGLAREGLALLSTVEDVELTPAQGRRLSLSGPLRHYKPVVGFTTALMEGTFVSTDVGAHSQEAILWPLNTLYEQSLRNVLDSWTGSRLQRPALRATIYAATGDVLGTSRVSPDYVLWRADGSRLVLDAKYKDVHPVNVDGTADQFEGDVSLSPTARASVRVRRSDIYQAVAYGRHVELSPVSVALAYPVALQIGEHYPWPVRIGGFDPEVWAVFFDVGPVAKDHLANFYQALSSLVPNLESVA